MLVNNAANDERHGLDAVTPEAWDRSQNVNLRHQFFAAQAVRPQMRERGGGAIVNFSSIAWMGGIDAGMIGYVDRQVGGGRPDAAVSRSSSATTTSASTPIAPGAVMTEKQLRLWHTEASTAASRRREAGACTRAWPSRTSPPRYSSSRPTTAA